MRWMAKKMVEMIDEMKKMAVLDSRCCRMYVLLLFLCFVGFFRHWGRYLRFSSMTQQTNIDIVIGCSFRHG